MDLNSTPQLPFEEILLLMNDRSIAPAVVRENNLSFTGLWNAPVFPKIRYDTLDCINDIFIIFANQIEDYSLNTSYASIMDCERFILRYIYIFLLGGIKKACSELHIDDNERRRLTDLLLNGSADSSVLYIVSLAEFLTLTIPFISSSFQLLLDRYKVNDQTNTRSADVVPIGHEGS